MMNRAVPGGIAEVTAQWLTVALRHRCGMGVTVETLTTEQVGTGQAGSTYRLTPTYSAGAVATLPSTLVLKLPAEDPDVRAGLSIGYRSEVSFYDTMALYIKAPIPQCFYSVINEPGTDFALLLSDEHPMVQGDQIAGCTAAQAGTVVEALAGLHGPTWCDPRWLQVADVAMPMPNNAEGAATVGEVAVMATEMVLGRMGSQLHHEDQATLRSAMASVRSWLGFYPRFSLIHGDFRADNVLFHPHRDSVKIVDWQTVSIGLPARDLAYFLASSLTPAERRRTERELVERYRAALHAHGVRGYTQECCWDDYRLGVLQAPMISVIGCAFAAATARGDEMFVQILRRSLEAIRDLDTLELLKVVTG